MAIYVWVFGVAVFAGLELYFGTRALRNLAPGIARTDITFFRKFAGQVDTKLFTDERQKYRAWMIRNEIAYVFWIFAIGPFAISLGRVSWEENSGHLAGWSYASLAASTDISGKDGRHRSGVVNSFCDHLRLLDCAALVERDFG